MVPEVQVSADMKRSMLNMAADTPMRTGLTQLVMREQVTGYLDFSLDLSSGGCSSLISTVGT